MLGVLHLLEHEEEYVFTLPSAYARSILTVPWVELGGKVSICCAKSGYSATVTFHTKPFYGGKVHRVTGEVKHNPTGTIVCKAQGEWNGTLEFTYSSGETKVIDTSKLPVIKKKIRPLEKQGQYESRGAIQPDRTDPHQSSLMLSAWRYHSRVMQSKEDIAAERRLWQHVTAALKAGDIDTATEHKHQLEEKQRREGKQRTSSSTIWKPKGRDGCTTILYGRRSDEEKLEPHDSGPSQQPRPTDGSGHVNEGLANQWDSSSRDRH
ncbi:Oxysterol-binding protein-related protein 10 [Anabarilius grahami]|uniref:Oxysterol-binding protein-related protein 10 n=1 Tax=Anabarilius grahami TaxID=495550 RepID=A0A3N0XS14_ANAGA|nr:Oxysterol-binding protein-related protein 10 [Anabarilius grahami]